MPKHSSRCGYGKVEGLRTRRSNSWYEVELKRIQSSANVAASLGRRHEAELELFV